MALPTPWQLANTGVSQRVRRIVSYIRDPYYFASTSVSQGTDQLIALIPATGPGAAGSTFPTNIPQTIVEVVVTGTCTPDQVYGSNLGRPGGIGANLSGGI